MPLFSIDLSEEFQPFLIVEALSAAIGIYEITLPAERSFWLWVIGFPGFRTAFSSERFALCYNPGDQCSFEIRLQAISVRQSK